MKRVFISIIIINSIISCVSLQMDYCNSNQNTSYNTKLSLKEEMNNKELQLQETIQYYKENIEQLIRIKLLEEELANLKSEIDHKYRIKSNEIQINKRNNEIIDIVTKNCEKAYKIYLEKSLNSMSYEENIRIEVLPTIGHGIVSLQYKFKKINENIYFLTCKYNGSITLSGSYNPTNNVCVLNIDK